MNKIIIFIFIIFVGCQEKNNKNKETHNKIRNEKLFIYDTYLKSKSNWNRILIFHYKESKRHYKYDLSSKSEPFFPDKIYECSSNNEIKLFDELLKKAERTGYCCCPNSNYLITFYNNTKEHKNFVVDTIESKNKIRIFDTGYQFSFLVKKENWNTFLKETNKVSLENYSLENLLAARKIYEKSVALNLPIISSNTVSKYWMFFDGHFKATVSSKDKKLTEENIYEAIKNKYPNAKFKLIVEFIEEGYNDKKGLIESKSNIDLFCNEDLYKIFDLYETKKSLFEKSNAEFYVLGSEQKLKEFDLQIKKEKIFF